jgi:hypothetical protein
MIKLASLKAIILSLAGLASMAGSACAQDYSDYEEHGVVVPPTLHSPSPNYLSYPYDPATDAYHGHATAPAAPNASLVKQKANDLATRAGIDLGLQISDYDYKEPSLGVELKGPTFGVTALMTATFGSQWFVTGDFRFAAGSMDYSSATTGSINGEFQDLWDIRGLVGRDFFLSNFSLSPYLGVGFRDLYSDDRGTTSTGALGYRRENQLLYIPIGVEPRFRVLQDARIASHIEYDYVTNGRQTSHYGDVNNLFPDLVNTQKIGYGIRGDVMWEQNNWAVGPFVNYWHMHQSTSNCDSQQTGGILATVCGFEPANHTFEGGIQFRYHVY